MSGCHKHCHQFRGSTSTSPLALGHGVSRSPSATCHRGHRYRLLPARAQEEEDRGASSSSDTQREPFETKPAFRTNQLQKKKPVVEQSEQASSDSSNDFDKIVESIAQDPEMRNSWLSIKQTMKTSMSRDAAEMWDEVEFEDVMQPREFASKMADAYVGPMLQAMQIDEEPLSFFVSLCQMAIAFQLLSAAATYLGVYALTDQDTGDALRCTCGLLLGYLSRPFLNVEQLLWPVYQAVMQAVAPPNFVYEVPPTSSRAVQSTLNRVGIFIAICFLIPQALWGWKTDDAAQFVAPLAAGWLLFDITLMSALLIKLRSHDREF